MRLLVLGGTQFLGRHVVERALGEGHDVTLFNRGRTKPTLFSGVRRLVGDRTPDGDPAGLTALATGTWDAAFDFSGFLPRQVAATAQLLAPRVGHYVFMSSIAVYPRTSQAGRTEDAETAVLPADIGEPDTFTAQTYGPLKAACERIVDAACPGRATSVRAGLVIGPGDRFGAFPSWAIAMAGTGTVPCAARPDQPLQVTDVRDFSAFMVRAGTVPLPGVFNVMAPPMTFTDLLETCRSAGGGSATVRWTDDENVDEHGAFIVQPRDGSDDGVFQLSCERALNAGYQPRPFFETARDTIEWVRRAQPDFTSPH
jgi:2'-hydroxyisoflavone reductase